MLTVPAAMGMENAEVQGHFKYSAARGSPLLVHRILLLSHALICTRNTRHLTNTGNIGDGKVSVRGGEPECGSRLIIWARGSSVGTDVFRVPTTRPSVTEPARGRMGPLQGHTAGSNNTYSTGQTVSQNNFIVPKIGVESTAETQDGRGVQKGGGSGKVGRKMGRVAKGRVEQERWGGCGKLGDWKRESQGPTV
ncbi:unnamed protein product [Pleuronectes platessa]|uniref:Uncharacterized protein n=1 Tax=Pleuronectes platessa TaxID=8262 RepID=A0A9N7VNQ2_PLEPL|nr:unnamed protein product [Pleuronectes platessa]